MPCACDRCRQHAVLLGLTQRVFTRTVLRKAFLAGARRWHPDRYERDPTQRLAAEEHFKLIQVAYRELGEHLKHPEKPAAGLPQDEPPTPPRHAQPPLPHIFFGNIPGCFATPHFPVPVRDIIAEYLQDNERAHAFIDLTATPTRAGDLSQYLLLTSYRVFFRNHLGIVSLLWYVDLGEILLTEPQGGRKPTFWQRLRGRFSPLLRTSRLEIRRHTGALFCTLTTEADDTVKKVVYNFLRHVKPAPPD